MHDECFYPSLTRISPLRERAWSVEMRRPSDWATGDYVLCEVDGSPRGHKEIELATGRMVEVGAGDRFIGTLGDRRATLEVTGSWQLTTETGQMDVLTSAGIVGGMTSISPFIPSLLRAAYVGHVILDGKKATMQRFVAPVKDRPFQTPVVLISGTSMSAGKTTAAGTIIRHLKRAGQVVLGAKLTGAGRYRDILSMKDAGAKWIYDFVDVGLPSTICPEGTYQAALSDLLSMMATRKADVAVFEVGSSPLEPYNGAAAIAAVRDLVRCTVLAASDPYAAYGVMHAFDIQPDFVCGIAVNTDAGAQLTEALCGVPALNVLNTGDHPAIDRILFDALEINTQQPL